MTGLSDRKRFGRSQALARKPPRVRKSKGQRPDESRYDAFISYSHALDGRLAASLQSELERFAKPWYRSRARRIFRDTTNLSAAPHLWDAIQAALAASTWYVLLASPEAAQSKWVDKEAKWWLERRTVDRLLVVLTGGELAWQPEAHRVDAARTTALPPFLVASMTDEPHGLTCDGSTMSTRLIPHIRHSATPSPISWPP